MTCKCGAATYEQHLRLVAEAKAAAHTYRGTVWLPPTASPREATR